MTELQLYKFITNNQVEISWRGESLILWIGNYYLSDFTLMLGYNIFDEGGIECRLCFDGSVGIDIVPICEYFDIEPTNIFQKNS